VLIQPLLKGQHIVYGKVIENPLVPA
jgi:hypothetical protein